MVVGLDHGGPWLRDKHSIEGWDLQRTMTAVKTSMRACLEAGYDLLHVDPTVDRSLPPGEAVPIHTVVDRTLEIISYVERLRREQGSPAISYEVGTEEVHGRLANLHSFVSFLLGVRDGLRERGLSDVWPVLVVGKVGTDLHTTQFDPSVACNLAEIAGAFGSLIKGHYTDSVSNPQEYPRVGMGGANVGPEFTQVEYEALLELYGREAQTGATEPCQMMEELRNAVIGSNRWRKWLSDAEQGLALSSGEGLVGDLIMGLGLWTRIPSYPIFADDLKQVWGSIRSIMERSPKIVYAGHGGPFSPEAINRKFNTALRSPSP